MEFKDSFFEDEVRDGFYVPSTIKRAWAAELEVLSEVDRICRKYDIQYFADWGTLLATVRHEGFIPWDDDLDIVMKRADYKRFMEVAQTELPEGFSAYNYENHDDFWLFLARVVGKQRICFEEKHLERFHQFPYIAGVDIFVLDYVSRDEKQEEERDKLALYVIAMADAIGEGKCNAQTKEMVLRKIETEAGVTIPRGLQASELRRALYRVAEQLFDRFSEEESDELTQLFPFGMKDKNFRFLKSYYEKAMRLPYENTTMPVPIPYNAALKKRYGDYMKLVRDAGGHDYPFFEAQHRQLQAVLDFELPQYRFSPEQLRENIGDNSTDADRENGKLQDDSESFKGLLQQCCDGLGQLLHETMHAAEQGDFREVLAKLQESQQLAIDMGTLIETFKGEEHPTVKLLENYCEALFEAAEKVAILESSDAQEQMAESKEAEMADGFALWNLEQALGSVRESAKRELLEQKNVVFLPYKAVQWDYLESVWHAAMEDPVCDVYVVPIPYYYKKYDGSYMGMSDERAGFPQKVTITDCENFNLELLHPDVIIIQNPYDEWNPVMSVPEQYYSSRLQQYTNQLVYIPPFAVEEFSRANERAFHNMECYCTMPGVVRADMVIVQSENMRRMYIEKLTEFAGEETRPVWEKKICGTGSPIWDQQESEEIKATLIPNSWKSALRMPDGRKKKMVVYGMNACCLAEYGEAVLQKAEKVLETFKEHRDEILLIWRPHPMLREFTEAACPDLWDEFRLIVERYQSEGWGMYEEDMDVNLLAEIADAYYGDGGSLAMAFLQEGKPVMIQNVEVF